MDNCIFCNIAECVLENDLAYARYDKYPVSEGHLLVIPKNHVVNYFDCSDKQKKALWSLVDQAKKILDKQFNPDSYNIGINAGAEAGQTVMHVHIHLIPRYKGDMDNPNGGVRGVIPQKQKY